MRSLQTANLVIAFIATSAPVAHLLEMFSKLTLDGVLWLQIQQHLYRGWGELFGPVEILALLTSIALLATGWRNPRSRRAFLVASLCYAAMIVVFFLFNAPVNAALSGWTPDTLPSTWTAYRLKWEAGHALAAVLSLIALASVLRNRIRGNHP